MAKVTDVKLWRMGDTHVIQIDFTGDRHYKIDIPQFVEAAELSRSLMGLARGISNDPLLVPRTKGNMTICSLMGVGCENAYNRMGVIYCTHRNNDRSGAQMPEVCPKVNDDV